MDRGTSLYLDLVRFAAAMVVLLGHLSGHRLTDGLFWQLSGFMTDAVAVFFVLSGYVIAYSTSREGETATGYVLDRAARIYSVAAPALVITFVLDTAGQYLRPDLYSSEWGFSSANPLRQYVSGILFLNQVWGVDIPQGSALPYWSLGYEVWYYVAFGVACFARGFVRPLLLVLCLAAMGPNVVTLFPLWLLGAATYKVGRSMEQRLTAGLLLFAATVLVWIVYQLKVKAHLPARSDLLGARDVYNSYCVGIIFAANLVALRMMSERAQAVLSPVAAAIRYLAGATFTIYLLHLPVAQFLITLAPAGPRTLPVRIAIEVATLVILFLIAEYTERRKRGWRRVFAKLLPSARSGPSTQAGSS